MSREGSTAGLTSAIRSAAGNATGQRKRALVVGGGHVGRTVAAHLNDDYDVALVSRNEEVVARTTRGGVTAHHVEEIDAKTLDEVGAGEVSVAVAAAEDDGRNFLVAQLLRTRFDVGHVVIRVDDREKLDSFDDLDVETVCVPDLLVEEVSDRLETAANHIEDA